MSLTTASRPFKAPGPGAWELDSTHFPRPMSAFASETFPEPFARGFAEGTAKFGILLDHLEMMCVNGFGYNAPRPVGAPKSAVAPPPKFIFKLLAKLHPAMRKRIRAARTALESRSWLADLKHWDDVFKPAAIKRSRAVQAIDVSRLDDAALVQHLREARELAIAGIYGHHRFTATACMPIGDFLAHAHEWTGVPVAELLQLLRGYSPVSGGMAAPELDTLVAAIRKADARKLLNGADAAAVLESLRARNDEVRNALAAYLDIIGYRIVTGYDVCDCYGHELPDVTVRTICAAYDAAATPDAAKQVQAKRDALTATVRDKVPEASRVLFDQLLDDARQIYRLRDERGIYNDAWTTGLARRSMQAAGKRLVEKGVLPDADLALDATTDELIALLQGQPGPSPAQLEERRAWRTTAKVEDAPAWLGAPPSPPPPAEWLPPHAARVARAMNIFLGALFKPGDKDSTGTQVHGIAVSPGSYEGTARLIAGPADFDRLRKGDVLLTTSTSPYFNPVLPLLGAIVTDRGGALSHAAIVAREYGIPGVVGTRTGTRTIVDGARVRVDGTAGHVTILS
ncbi:MAG: PEP-utilizing enzyme [Planctomycetota bacterium]